VWDPQAEDLDDELEVGHILLSMASECGCSEQSCPLFEPVEYAARSVLMDRGAAINGSSGEFTGSDDVAGWWRAVVGWVRDASAGGKIQMPRVRKAALLERRAGNVRHVTAVDSEIVYADMQLRRDSLSELRGVLGLPVNVGDNLYGGAHRWSNVVNRGRGSRSKKRGQAQPPAAAGVVPPARVAQAAPKPFGPGVDDCYASFADRYSFDPQSPEPKYKFAPCRDPEEVPFEVRTPRGRLTQSLEFIKDLNT